MGFNFNGSKLLLYAQSENLNIKKTITLGRQELHLSEKQLEELLDKYGYESKAAGVVLQQDNGYCEPLLKLLGAQAVDSIDASHYENATIIHDMNCPIPDSLKGQYSLVVDSGTLEHIFNFPIAIKNCMELLEESGYFIGITPANNFLGHGFYQFSPELLYRVFSQENGFTVLKMIFFTDDENTEFYEVSDPLVLRERVILANHKPSYLCVIAQKTRTANIFEKIPQQSDYEYIRWTHSEGNINTIESKSNILKALVPNFVKHQIKYLYKKGLYLKKILSKDIGDGDPTHFTKIKI